MYVTIITVAPPPAFSVLLELVMLGAQGFLRLEKGIALPLTVSQLITDTGETFQK